jgi:TRAP-type C4-dicarboxylate transport system permease small subunit
VVSLRNSLDRALEWVVIVLMAALALTVVAGFVFRQLGAPLVWYDEVAPIQLAWLTYYGSGLAALRRAHIGFPKLVQSAPLRLRIVLGWIRAVVVVAFFAVAAWAGWKVLEILGDTYLISLPWMSTRITQSVIPIGSVIFIVAEIVAFIGWLEEQREAPAA